MNEQPTDFFWEVSAAALTHGDVATATMMTFPRRRLEPLTQRVRARSGKRIILDTTHAQLLFEDERHPWRLRR
jgi:hypothetical protein